MSEMLERQAEFFFNKAGAVVSGLVAISGLVVRSLSGLVVSLNAMQRWLL